MPSSRTRRLLLAPAVAALLLATPLSAPAALGAAVLPTPAPGSAVAAGTTLGGDALGTRGTVLDLQPGTPAPPAPKAVSWLVADLDTRQIIAAHDVHERLAPASTMKIFTALTLAPRLDPESTYTASEAATAVDGTKVGLVAGSRYTVDQLLHGMLMSSGNDCAVALGELTGGQPKAIALMQAKARSLGAYDTSVRTTSGLDAPGQASSAYDLALAGAQALKSKQLATIMTTKAFAFPAAGKGLGESRKTFSIQTHDKLLYNTPGATGVKNGYTIAARGSYVGSATRAGHSYLAVVLRAEGSTWHQVDDLLEWAFANGAQAGPVGTLVTPAGLAAARATPTVDAARGAAAAAGSAELRGALTPGSEPDGGSALSGQVRTVLLVVLAAGLLLAAGAAGLMLRPAAKPEDEAEWVPPSQRSARPAPPAPRRQGRGSDGRGAYLPWLPDEPVQVQERARRRR